MYMLNSDIEKSEFGTNKPKNFGANWSKISAQKRLRRISAHESLRGVQRGAWIFSSLDLTQNDNKRPNMGIAMQRPQVWSTDSS